MTGSPDGPEVRVSRPAQLVKPHAGVRRIKLKIEGGGLDRLLFLAAQLGEAVGEGVGDAELH